MDKELQEYYEKLLGMFAQDGWKLFIEDVTSSKNLINDLATIKDEQSFWQRRGQLEFIHKVLSFEQTIKDSYDQAQEEQDD